MGIGFSFRVAPGVRIRSTPRGLRTSIGPRAARIHVGGGRPTVSTGWGPFTWWTPVGAGRRQRPVPGARPRAAGPAPVAAARAAEAARRIEAITELHRPDFPTTTRPVAPPPTPVDEQAVRRRHRAAATAGIGLFDRAGRATALQQADRDAAAEIRARQADNAWIHADKQAAADAWFTRLTDNDPDTVLETLARMVTESHGTAVPIRVQGGEATVAVLAPPDSVVPEQVPTTTPEGTVRLRRPTASQAAAMYTAAVLGCVLATVKEVLATAPGLHAARVVVVRRTDPDAYGHTQLCCLLAGRWSRTALGGVQWHAADAATIAQQTASELQANLRRGTELVPLDLSDKPDLRDLLRTVDVVDSGR